jgi:UrcA family protein
MRLFSSLTISLFAGTIALSGPSADAQSYDGPTGAPVYQSGPPEQVEVYGPRFREERTPLNAPLGKVSVAVPYGDLDLRTRRGAFELRRRVRDAAWNVCGQLAEAYPFYEANNTSCLKTAYENAIVRVKATVGDARIAWRLDQY